MLKLFSRKRRRLPSGETTPQLTGFQRRSLTFPGIPPGPYPYATYDQMEQDSMIQTCLTVKRLGVLAAPWRIVAAGALESVDVRKDGRVVGEGKSSSTLPDLHPSTLPDVSDRAKRNAEFAQKVLEEMDGSPHAILSQAMDAFCKGWSVQELVWEVGGSVDGWTDGRVDASRTSVHPHFHTSILLRATRPKDPSLFGLEVDPYGNIQRLKLQLPGEPEREIPRAKFAVYLNRSSYGRAKGRSDLDAAWRHWDAKQRLLGAWRYHLERFAMPTITGKFLRGLPQDEQSALMATLQNLQDNVAVLYPEEVTLGQLGGDKEASAGFMEAIDFHNREMARAILGQTLTTDEGKRVGSLALGKVHLQVLLLQLESLRKELADTVMTEQIIRPLIELNFGPGDIPRFEFEETRLSAFASGDIG